MKPQRHDSQKKEVLKALRRKAGLTTLGALELGVCSLPSIVMRLRRAGVAIDAQWQAGVNRYGRVIRFKQYRLLQSS